jgi:hypothetical protein
MSSTPPSQQQVNRKTGVILLIVLALLGAVGLAIFRWKEKAVFPSASIDLKISKRDILLQADSLAKALGYHKDRAIRSITFGYDDESKTFLEYELGNSVANQLMRNTVPIFYWTCKFRKEFDQETMDICLSPTGKLIFFDFNQPNDKVIPSIKHDKAKRLAQAFVTGVCGWTEATMKLVDDQSITCPHRIDHSFTWEYQTLDWNGAKLRARAEVSGNYLASFNIFLNRPEEWDRKYSTIRSNNELLYAVANIFYTLLYIAALFIFFDAISKKRIRWKFTLIASACLSLLFFLDHLNNLPATLAEYDPRSSYSTFVIECLLQSLVSIPAVFALSLIMVGAAEVVYRTSFPHMIALERLATGKSLATRQIFDALFAGQAAFGISLGYQICYYWLGQKINYWCPLSLDNYQLLTAVVPSISAISTGVFASGSEEVLYRVLMLSLLQRALRNFWWANLLQAAAWGFMHSTYPQQPAYARGIELTIEGMFNGWLIRRYGLLACFVSHYLFDAFCEVIPLWSAPTIMHKIGALVPLIPFAILTVAALVLRRKEAQGEDALLNLAIETPPLPERPSVAARIHTPLVYESIASKWRYGIAGFVALGAVLLLCYRPTYCIYQHPKPLKVARDEATSIAHDYLIDQHFDLTGYQITSRAIAAIYNISDLESQYAFEKAGFAKANELAEAIVPSYTWQIRFFKPLCPEEYCVYLDQNGQMLFRTITKDENASGAKLDQAAAQKIAEAYVQKYRPIYVPFEFDNAGVSQRKNRTDYDFTFKVPKFKVADADFFVTVQVVGDMPSAISHYWKLPDQWRWDREKQQKKDEILRPIMIGLGAVFAIAVLWWIFTLFREHVVRWRNPLIVSSVLAVFTLIQGINLYPLLFASYATTTPVQTYLVMLSCTLVVGLGFTIASMAFAISIAWGGLHSDELKDKFLGTISLLLRSNSVASAVARRALCLDAILLALGCYIVWALFVLIESVVKFHFAQSVQIGHTYAGITSLASCLSPSIDILSSLAGSMVMSPIFLAIMFGLATKYRITSFWRYFLLSFGFLLLSNALDRYWQDFLIAVAFGAVEIILFWFFVTRCVVRNMATLFAMAWLGALEPQLVIIYRQGFSLFPFDFAVCCALLVLPLLYVIYLHWQMSKKPPAEPIA